MTISILDSYGYGALIGGVVAYHLFPDFVGGKNEADAPQGPRRRQARRQRAHADRDGDRYLADRRVSLADFYLAPILAYVTMTPHKDEFLGLPDVQAWWDRISASASFRATQP